MEKEKTPALIQLIAIVGFILGLAALLFDSIFISAGVNTWIIAGLVADILLILGSYGLRVMKKWGLYLFSLSVIYSIFYVLNRYITLHIAINSTVAIELVIMIIALVYPWALYRKFN